MKVFYKRIEYALKYFPDLSTSPVLDVGCGDAVHLKYFGKGSIGLDARKLGNKNENYRFIQWNFNDDILDILLLNDSGKFKYVWCNSVIEHSISPHLFLINLRRCMEEEGLLFLGSPLANGIGTSKIINLLKPIKNLFHGFLSQDHINFFTYKTLKLTCEFAGFEIIAKYSPFLPFKNSPLIGCEPFIMLILQKREFQYGIKAYKTLDEYGRFQWKNLSEISTKELPK